MRIGAGEGYLLIATEGQGPGSVLSQLVGCRSAGKSTCLVPSDQSRSPRASVTLGLPRADGRSRRPVMLAETLSTASCGEE